MVEKPTAEISQETWRFFNQMKHRPREPIGEVVDRTIARLQSSELHEELAKMLHAKFISTIQIYGRLADAQSMLASYNELSEPDREYLRAQADEILTLIRGGQDD